MKKKVLAAIMAAAIAATALTGCGFGAAGSTGDGDSAAVSASVPTEPFGDTVKYDPSVAINDGKDITVELWEWGSDELFQQVIDGYQAIHPNVTIKLVNNPWEDYWTKLPLALDGENGPAIFNVHNSYHENLINYLAPLDIPLEDLQADFNGVEAHVIDGKVYYIDYGMMTGSVYYNKDMWEAAGLTENDIPKTWDEMREVAKKLTIKEGDSLVQAGLNFNDDFHQNYLLGLNYQLGDNLFLEDGKTPNVNTDNMKKVMQMLVDMYEVDGVGSKDFGEKCADSFGQGQSAMVIQWGHYYNTLKTTWTDINFGVFEIPTFDGEPYAYNRYNGESTFGINKNAPAEQQAVAQDFVKYFLANDEAQIAFNMAMSTFPAKKSLASNEEVMQNPSLSILAEHIDHYIWPGPMPSTMETSLKKAGQDIFFNGVDIDTALNEAQESIIRDMKSSTFVSVENLYKYAK
ncbi:MAG: extracellular solute-binding protein [Lachnospiraceae bacterium]|nr:extracellular solute-binding protein [Lachnospiraceae bacterium]